MVSVLVVERASLCRFLWTPGWVYVCVGRCGCVYVWGGPWGDGREEWQGRDVSYIVTWCMFCHSHPWFMYLPLSSAYHPLPPPIHTVPTHLHLPFPLPLPVSSHLHIVPSHLHTVPSHLHLPCPLPPFPSHHNLPTLFTNTHTPSPHSWQSCRHSQVFQWTLASHPGLAWPASGDEPGETDGGMEGGRKEEEGGKIKFRELATYTLHCCKTPHWFVFWYNCTRINYVVMVTQMVQQCTLSRLYEYSQNVTHMHSWGQYCVQTFIIQPCPLMQTDTASRPLMC